MGQSDYIKEITRLALANDKNHLLETLYEFVDYSQKNNRAKFAAQLQSIIKASARKEEIGKLKEIYNSQDMDTNSDNIILQTVISSFQMKDLICQPEIKEEFEYFIKERKAADSLSDMNIPVSNKIILHGPSGCGKTLAAYVLAGELQQPLIIVNLGAVVSSKLGETSKNLTKIFKKACYEKAIILLDEFDSLGKIRDYDQDHGEMKRVVNTILQLFDFMSQNSIIIAATNQLQMIDDALIRRFDLSLKLDFPQADQVRSLIDRTINGRFTFDNMELKDSIIEECHGISYYIIKRTLLNAIKRTILDGHTDNIIQTQIWKKLIFGEIQDVEG